MNPASLEAEIRCRAGVFLSQSHLPVDYYRIRRRVAYPLPVRSIQLPGMPVADLQSYPWATWMTWALEERIESLGWAAEWFGDAAARGAAAKDLEALAAWPSYRQYEQPDLCLGHAARTLWHAHAHWKWVEPALRAKIESAFARIIADILPLSEQKHGAYARKEDILALPEPHKLLHNIPIIGTVGAALAANALLHPSAAVFNRRLHALLGALLDLRERGHTEGLAYDGYVMDFAADWLRSLPAAERAPLLKHPRLHDGLEMSYMLAAPGAAAEVAELSDVEPRRMPFHLSALAKLEILAPEPRRAWHLGRCPADWLRADALAALHARPEGPAGPAPAAGALDAHYAVVLRSGWEASDLAVAIAASNSPMGHVHCDSGSLTIGTAGRWLITDPGYQQYMKKQERQFTLGPCAHNAPVINGLAQNTKAVRRLAREERGGVLRAKIDLTGCYPPILKIERALRTVWLWGKQFVVVADEMQGATVLTQAYHWHGHADAAWWAQDGWATLCLPGAGAEPLWITTPQASISGAAIDRFPGSRGQLTLHVFADVKAPVVWWVFACGPRPPEVALAEGGRGLTVAGQRLVAD